jgi:dimethylamine/trimethylamine dehydrogenase
MLQQELRRQMPPAAVSRIGDCLSPSHIADAVYSGHRFAREFDEPKSAIVRRERPEP